MRSSARGSAGMTLIEVVIAVAILAVGVLAAAGMQASSLRANRAAQDIQRVNALARSQLDAWRGSVFSQTAPTTVDCGNGELSCQIQVRPCTLAGAELVCTLGSVAAPVAHALTVTAASGERDVTFSTVVMR